MDLQTINDYEKQYNPEGGCWNKETCLRDNKIETYSGPGSLLENTDLLVENLNKFISEYNIKSIIDVPCGDFNYMSKVNLDNVDYNGYDISLKAINLCKNKNNKNNINFKVFDITSEKLPYADLIIIKDLFLHLSYDFIQKSLNNVKESGCKYFAVSRYGHGTQPNKDQVSGLGCRSIEVTKTPINFNYPIIFTTYNTSLHTVNTWQKDQMIIFKLN